MTYIKILKQNIKDIKTEANAFEKKYPKAKFANATFPDIVNKIAEDIFTTIGKDTINQKEYDKYNNAIYYNINLLREIEETLCFEGYPYRRTQEMMKQTQDIRDILSNILDPTKNSFTSSIYSLCPKEISDWQEKKEKYRYFDQLVSALDVFLNNKKNGFKSLLNEEEIQIIDRFINTILIDIVGINKRTLQGIGNEKIIELLNKGDSFCWHIADEFNYIFDGNREVIDIDIYEYVVVTQQIKQLTHMLADTPYGGKFLPFLKIFMQKIKINEK